MMIEERKRKVIFNEEEYEVYVIIKKDWLDSFLMKVSIHKSGGNLQLQKGEMGEDAVMEISKKSLDGYKVKYFESIFPTKIICSKADTVKIMEDSM